MLSRLLKKQLLTKEETLMIALGCLIMTFGIVNIHLPARITEGGVLGFVMLVYKLFDLDPSVMSFLADLTCYSIGFKLLGKDFLFRAIQTSLIFALCYRLMIWVGPILPSLVEAPLLASLLGGILIGVGCGLCISQSCAAGGDDALAMVIADQAGWSIAKAYLLSDGVVLLLSLTYLEPNRLIYSFLTTLVSSFIIGQFELHFPSLQTLEWTSKA